MPSNRDKERIYMTKQRINLCHYIRKIPVQIIILISFRRTNTPSLYSSIGTKLYRYIGSYVNFFCEWASETGKQIRLIGGQDRGEERRWQGIEESCSIYILVLHVKLHG